MAWLSQFFLHPGLAVLGAALISVPVIIHLLNRLQYRKVRFAAMEFLLQSQQRNRRRILLEQLLLLLLRVLIVLFLMALFARLILDPSQLSLLERPETHHLVILDDSGSMQDRWAETNAFREGLAMVKRLTSDLAGQEGLQLLTLLTTSEPDRTSANFTQRQIDVAMVSEFEDKLEAMQRECGYARTSWPETIAAIKRVLSTSAGQQHIVHVISDFRASEWKQAPQLLEQLKQLADEKTVLNLIPAVPGRHANLAVTGLSGEVQTAAVRVPLQLTAEITNFSEMVEENISVRVLLNGEPIPQSITIPTIEPGDTVRESFEVVLTTPGEHAIAVQIPSDSLDADNIRHLTLYVPDRQRVLIVDGSEEFTEGYYVSDALSADASVTGIDVLLIRPEALRDQDLSRFMAVYLLNIPELAADIVALLGDYVQEGGGIAWFLGDRVNATFYRQLNEQPIVQDSADEAGTPQSLHLFSVPISPSPVELPAADETAPGSDLQLTTHPLFEFLNAADGLLSHYVRIYRYFPVDEQREGGVPAGTRVIGRLRNQSPLFFESQVGKGRIFTALTSVGPMATLRDERWHNWSFDMNAPGFTVFHLELVKYLGSRQGQRTEFEVGQPWDVTVNPASYLPEVRVDPPDGAPSPAVVLNATPPVTAETGGKEAALLTATYAATNFPGVYRLTRENLGREAETELKAFNVPVEESALDVVSPAELRTLYASVAGLLVQEYGELEGIRRSDPGRELRTLLMTLLIVILVGEQALAYRLSYHQRGQRGGTRGELPGNRWTNGRASPLRPEPELAASNLGGPPR